MPQIKHPIFTRYWKLLLPLMVLFIIWFLFTLTSKTIPNSINYKILNQDLALVPDEPIAFKEQVEPILQHRCVVCHGCYDAPCQLKLSSIEGLQRGANEERIYEPKRIGTMEPTRLFIDAKTTAEWRLRDFFSVLNEGEQTPYNNLENSVLYRLLNLKKQHPQATEGLLSNHFTLELDREQSCPTLDTIDHYAQENPQWGMPYAMPNLSNSEHQTLVSWLAQGAKTPPPPPPSPSVLPQIKQWEDFLNQSNNKQQLVSRYLYEHLFHAHIHFKDSPDREFYRLIRSTTPSGEKPNEIATIRPYDSPGESPFYYRLIRYHPTIVVKSHIVYELSPQKMQRYRALFIEPDYQVAELPNYHSETSANPFKVFAALPEKSRYRFLLDDAHFFIEGFIKGPVCRGQVALDVIEDQFWIVFFDPDQPLITNND
ncbi:MAG: fatty acid cis/trans isomerase, partial [Thiomicrorhabdus sp.]|nr:fatty acid cis/trans isomerase [Thiomicrorhabdus sp.]